MTRSRKSLMLAILLAFLVAAPAHAQRSSSASHTVTIQVLPAANVDADDFIAFGMSVLGEASETRTAEAHTSLSVRSMSQDVRVAVGLSEELPPDIRLRLADNSGNRVALSASSTEILTHGSGSGEIDLTFEAEVDGDFLYLS